MTVITEIPNTKWRDELLPATFRGAEFHCETGTWSSGHRIVEHEFPKRDLPYAETMGHRAVEFSVRGYCIAYPLNAEGGDSLWQRDYRKARNALKLQLDSGDRGLLQLPGLEAMWVVCQRYRLTEEQRLGGYCVFDMDFVEYGQPVEKAPPNPRIQLINRSRALRQQIRLAMAKRPLKPPGPPSPIVRF